MSNPALRLSPFFLSPRKPMTGSGTFLLWLLTCYDGHLLWKLSRDRRLKEQYQADASTLQTVELLQQAQKGDRRALNGLFERLAPPLQRIARGKLPGWARGMISTVDLVQETLFSTFKILEKQQASDDFAIHAYVRKSLNNRMIDELRKVNRRPSLQPMEVTVGEEAGTPLQEAIGDEALQRYENALQRLDPVSREAVLARIELGMSYAEIARLTAKPSADAARMSVSRSLVQLAEAMNDE